MTSIAADHNILSRVSFSSVVKNWEGTSKWLGHTFKALEIAPQWISSEESRLVNQAKVAGALVGLLSLASDVQSAVSSFFSEDTWLQFGYQLRSAGSGVVHTIMDLGLGRFLPYGDAIESFFTATDGGVQLANAESSLSLSAIAAISMIALGTLTLSPSTVLKLSTTIFACKLAQDLLSPGNDQIDLDKNDQLDGAHQLEGAHQLGDDDQISQISGLGNGVAVTYSEQDLRSRIEDAYREGFDEGVRSAEGRLLGAVEDAQVQYFEDGVNEHRQLGFNEGFDGSSQGIARNESDRQVSEERINSGDAEGSLQSLTNETAVVSQLPGEQVSG